MEQSNSVRLGLHAYAAFAACQEPWECARYLFSRPPPAVRIIRGKTADR